MKSWQISATTTTSSSILAARPRKLQIRKLAELDTTNPSASKVTSILQFLDITNGGQSKLEI